jgi:peptidoglycan/LPS O-acetylase OafA/YrhL
MDSRIQFLDGLRGVAALVVIWGHAINQKTFGSSPYVIGTSGVWAFFVLSSFLLTIILYRRLEEDCMKLYPIRCSLGEYAIRRFMRIYPLYFIVVVFCWMAPSWTPSKHNFRTINTRWQTIFLVNAYAHLWTVPVEMQSYLLLPFIVFAVYYARRFWILPTLGYFTYAFTHFQYIPQPEKYHFSTLYEALPTFMYGSLGGIVYLKLEEFISAKEVSRRYPRIFSVARVIADISCWLLLALFLRYAIPHFNRVLGDPKIRPNDPKYQAPIFSVILVLAMFSQRSFTGYFEGTFFVYCGKISYAMYLTQAWPRYAHDVFFGWNGHEGLIAVFVMTIGLATIVYHMVELPFQRAALKLVKRWRSKFVS